MLAQRKGGQSLLLATRRLIGVSCRASESPQDAGSARPTTRARLSRVSWRALLANLRLVKNG